MIKEENLELVEFIKNFESFQKEGNTFTEFLRKESTRREVEKLKNLVKELIGMNVLLEFNSKLFSLMETNDLEITITYHKDRVDEEVESIHLYLWGEESEERTEMMEAFADYIPQLEFEVFERLDQETEIKTGKEWLDEYETYGTSVVLMKDHIGKYE